MGEGLKRARKAARATRKPSPQVIMVTNSSGCIFCDLDLEPELVKVAAGHWRNMHTTKSGSVACTRDAEE